MYNTSSTLRLTLLVNTGLSNLRMFAVWEQWWSAISRLLITRLCSSFYAQGILQDVCEGKIKWEIVQSKASFGHTSICSVFIYLRINYSFTWTVSFAVDFRPSLWTILFTDQSMITFHLITTALITFITSSIKIRKKVDIFTMSATSLLVTECGFFFSYSKYLFRLKYTANVTALLFLPRFQNKTLGFDTHDCIQSAAESVIQNKETNRWVLRKEISAVRCTISEPGGNPPNSKLSLPSLFSRRQSSSLRPTSFSVSELMCSGDFTRTHTQ